MEYSVLIYLFLNRQTIMEYLQNIYFKIYYLLLH